MFHLHSLTVMLKVFSMGLGIGWHPGLGAGSPWDDSFLVDVGWKQLLGQVTVSWEHPGHPAAMPVIPGGCIQGL